MNVQVRPLRPEDIRRVVEIERQAFPTLLPPTPFKRELDNRLAKYLVAWERKAGGQERSAEPEPERQADHRGKSVLGRILAAITGWSSSTDNPVEPDHNLLGFVGLWFMAGEAHITAIAVDEVSRGKSIGELLLMGSIELAMNRRSKEVTLEARVSNYVAQSLYEKYGFEKVGIRKGYYTDNREDAVIMTTEPLSSPAYQAKFQALKDAYRRRHGQIKIALG